MVQQQVAETDIMQEQTSAAEHAHDIDPSLIRDIKQAVGAEDVDMVRQQLGDLDTADQAELLNILPADNRAMVAEALDDEALSEVLPDLHPEVADDVLEALGIERSAEAVGQLETDDAIHIIEELDAEDQRELLEAMPEASRDAVEEGLSYPEDSAGRLMTRAYVSVPSYYTVGDTIDYLRAHETLPEMFYIIYATDPKFHPVGRVQLGKLMRHKREVGIGEIMDEKVYATATDEDQEEVAYLFRKYALVEAPVVNDQGRLVGTITVDDVVDVIREEEEEDYLRSGGVTSQDLQIGLKETARRRFPWLFINLITAVMASAVIGMFAETIEKLVALAVLMPIVASMGGNAGTQSVTVAVRAIATRQLQTSNALAAVRKELMIGVLNGIGLALIMAAGTWFFYQDGMLALVLGGATIATLAVAGFSGALIPVVLQRFKIDPAVASGIFLTTITDVIGFFTFLGLAALLLMR